MAGRAAHDAGWTAYHSPLATLAALTLRAVFRLALRQTQRLIGSVIRLLGLDLAVPDHSTLSRRAETLEAPRPRSSASGKPVPLLVDSTGLKLCGAGESDPIASFTGDGAYDQEGVAASVAVRHPQAAIIVPPRANAVPSETAETTPAQRGRHLQHVEPRGSPDIAERGRMAWHKVSGYTKRARAETGLSRLKQAIGDGLRSHADERQATEVGVAVHVLSRRLELGRPNSVRTA